MNTNFLVTILSPCYNVEKFLPKCLDSIINQTYSNLQIVLIDDGSKDGTWGIMQEYATKDSRIEVYHQENKGVATTRNHLLDRVNGDYVLFVDADDWIELDMVKFLVDLAVEYTADVVTCSMIKNNQSVFKGACSIESWTKELTVKEFLGHLRINGSLCNKLVKSVLFVGECIDTKCSYGEDALMFWHVIQKIKCLIQTDKQLYHYRMNDSSLSHLAWTPEKKGSGHLAWKQITNEANVLWPQYAAIGNARYAIEDMWGLYYASLANYPYDEHIKERQKNIRRNLKLIRKSGLVSKNKIFTAFVLAYCYFFGRFLKYTRK